ncbi:MFS transporter [Streptomyces sp. NPDC059534]|uniref:MFS transporter n=1 Tax=Streptomyces sp. NPDC059534 TaxID=3346859 RepID=UPI0036BA396E
MTQGHGVTTSPKRNGGPWSHQGFRLLLIGETTSKLGTNVTSVLLPLVAISTLDASPLVIGVLTAAPWLPWLVIGLPAGAWVDRLPRRAVMLCCNVVSATLLATVPAAAWTGLLSTWQLLAVALVNGVCSVFFSTACSAYLPSLIDKADLMEGNAKLQGAEQAARVAGPGAGGLLAQALGSATGLLVDVLSFLVSSLCLLLVRDAEPRPARRVDGTLWRDMADGLRIVTRDPYVRTLTLFGAALNLALAGYQAVLLLFLVRTVEADPGLIGLLISCGGVGGILGGLVSSHIPRRLGTARGLITVQLVTAPFALLIPLAGQGPRLALFVVGSTVMTAGIVASNVIIVSFRQSYCPPEMLGRVTSSALFVNFGTIPVGALVGSTLATVLGLRPTMWVLCTGICATSGLLLAGPLRRMRDLPRALVPVHD